MKKTISIIVSAGLAMMMVVGFFSGCGKEEPKEPATVSVTGVSLNKSSINLTEGSSESLTATVSPDNATNKAVSWKSSDAAVVTVDGSGKVTAVKAGSATITVTSSDGSKTATCSVTVAVSTVPVTGVTIDKTEISIVEGESQKLSATVAPDNATDKKVTWTSSDNNVATVDGSGNVTAVKAGSATITAKAGDKTATCSVTVTAKEIKLESIAVEPATKQVKEGETFELTVKFLPAGAPEKSVSWRSTNPEVATVEGGTVTPLKAGKTKIFARVDGTEIEASCDLTVTQDPTLRGIAFTSDRFGVSIGDPKKLELIFTPDYAANKVVTFSSSDPSIATVNADGIVNGLSHGETTITAKSMEGGFEASCKVIVTSSSLAGLYWTQNNHLMYGGEPLGIPTYYTPGVDPEGNMYYVHVDNYYGKFLINKNGVDIHAINADGLYDGRKSAAGGGYFFIEIERDYRKSLSVLRVSDEGEEKEFSLYKADESFNYEVYDVFADSKGNFYAAGYFTDEYNVDVAALWTLSVDGKVTQTTFGDGSRDMHCYAVAASGNDVWCLVWEGTNNNGRNILAAYKNGKRQYQLCDDVCQRGGSPCEIGIAGNDVYAAVNNDFEHNNRTSRIEVFKNGEIIYTPIVHEYVYLYSFFVTPDGDTYVSGYRNTDSRSYNYIWKNDTAIYSPDGIAWDLFVKK
ncbi:MAG: Ig domain-containing protein [Bacteroidales bacterium]|nr:Ig domain-containing protein [Bacteroidales bacterium]